MKQMTPLLPALLDTQASKKCVSMYGFCKVHTFSTGRNMEGHLHHHHYMSMLVNNYNIIPFILSFSCRKYRYIAYRQLTRWCWGWLGRNIRVILPACAVKKIRDTFPSHNYTGFNLPNIRLIMNVLKIYFYVDLLLLLYWVSSNCCKVVVEKQ